MTTVPLSFHGEILERLISFFENGRVFVTLGSRYMSARYGRKRRKVTQSNEKNRRVEIDVAANEQTIEDAKATAN